MSENPKQSSEAKSRQRIRALYEADQARKQILALTDVIEGLRRAQGWRKPGEQGHWSSLPSGGDDWKMVLQSDGLGTSTLTIYEGERPDNMIEHDSYTGTDAEMSDLAEAISEGEIGMTTNPVNDSEAVDKWRESWLQKQSG